MRILLSATTVAVPAKALCDCTSAKIHPNQRQDDGHLILAHFSRAACLLLAWCLLTCCLLAAKPGRCTLDTKKGYKTMTGSTSSVTRIPTLAPTLTLTLTLNLTLALTLNPSLNARNLIFT